jgi:hypothetical protein
VDVPPVGRVGYRKGQWSEPHRPPAPEDEARRLESLKTSKWTLDKLRVLGTAPDREVARKVGKNRNSVALMRRSLGIPSVDARFWDGVERPQALSDEELTARWDNARRAFVASKASST